MPESKDSIDYKQRYLELLYAISHDLRAPVRHTSNFYSLLIEEHESQWSGDQIEYQAFINKALKKAEEQFERLLILSRLHSRQKKCSEFSLYDCITQIISLVQEESDKQIEITLNIEKALVIELPINLVKQTLYELIKNAFVHGCSHESPQLMISGTIEQGPQKQNQQKRLVISLSDNGKGMDEGSFNKSFLPFSRLVENAIPGVGLGLTIAQQATEIMAGKIELTSTEGLQATLIIPVNHSLNDTEQS